MDTEITHDMLKATRTHVVRPRAPFASVSHSGKGRLLSFNREVTAHLGRADRFSVAYSADTGKLTFSPFDNGSIKANPYKTQTLLYANQLLRFIGANESFRGRLPVTLNKDGSITVSVKRLVKRSA